MDVLVQLGKILSDSNRVKILALLYREKELCVCELCDTLELSQPLVSRHLKKMRELHLVQTHKEGKWIVYSLQTNSNLLCLLQSLQVKIQDLPSIVTCTTR